MCPWISKQSESTILACARSGLIDLPLRPPVLLLMCPGDEAYQRGKSLSLWLSKAFRTAHYSQEPPEDRDNIYKPSAKYPYILSTSDFENPWE